MSDKIPLIDLTALQTGPAGVNKLALELKQALEEVGFLILINHSVPSKLIRRAFKATKQFHDQPMIAKCSLLMNEHNNGYMAEGRYNVRTSRASESFVKPDANEAFFVKRERTENDPLVIASRRFAGPNQWPQGINGFRETVLAYTEAVDLMARRLLPSLAISLDLKPDYFDAAFAESQYSFRMSHYPPTTREEGLYGIAPHTDMNFMTFLPQSNIPGLQIATSPNDWQDIPFIPDSFVVNTGDTLHRWTNGRYCSTPHRVLPPTEEHRYAIPFFFGPHLDTKIKCLPTCQDAENPPKFSPITYSDFMNWWYDANYDASNQTDLAI